MLQARQIQELLRPRETLIDLILVLFIGIGTGFGAIGFRLLIGFFQHFYFTGGQKVLGFLGGYYVILVPMLGGLVVGPLTYFLAREAKGHGVPEVMAAVAFKGGVIRPRVVIVKALASAICIGSGGSVGREGPIVQIGSAIGSTIGQLCRVNTRRLKIFVACGAAGGIAATFNAPIGGVLFALEVILGKFSGGHLILVVVSSMLARYEKVYVVFLRENDGQLTSKVINGGPFAGIDVPGLGKVTREGNRFKVDFSGGPVEVGLWAKGDYLHDTHH